MMMRGWLKSISNILSGPNSRRSRLKAARHRRIVLNLEQLELRETPSATITSAANSIDILVPASETAVLNLNSGYFTVTDSAGVTGSGGNIVSNTFTASYLAEGQTAFGVDASSGGTVQLGAASIIPAATTVTVGAGALDLNGFSEIIGALNGAGTVTNTLPASMASLTIGSNNGSGSFSGSIENSGTGVVAVVKVGSGTEAFSGTNAYSGGTTINEGVLEFDSDATIQGSGPVTVKRGGTAAAGYAIDQAFLAQIASTSAGVVALGADSANALDFSAATGADLTTASLGAIPGSGTTQNTFTYSGTLTPFASTYLLGGGGGALTISSALPGVDVGDALVIGLNGTPIGPVILTGADTYTGNTTIHSGSVLQLGNGGTSAPILSAVTDNGNLTIDDSGPYTVSQSISGIGSLTQAGSGTTTLSVSDSYSGGTTINAGALGVGADNELGADPANLSAANIVINGGTLDAAAGFTLNSNRGIALGSAAGGSGEIDVASGQTLIFNGVITNHGGASGLTVGSGANSGTLVLGGNNSFSGGVDVVLGTLSISADANLGADPGTATASNVVIQFGGTLLATTSFTLNSNRGLAVASGGGEIDVAAGQSLAYGGIIAGVGLTVGSGTHTGAFTLSGINTYTGPTTIDAGTLSVGADGNLGNAAGGLVINGGTLLITNGFTTDRGVAVGPASGSGSGEIDVAAGQTLVVGGTSTIVSATAVGNTATITTSTPHSFVVGGLVTIANVSGGSGNYNGTFTITSVPTSTTFTMSIGSPNPGTGTGGTAVAGAVANNGAGTGLLTAGSGTNTGTLVLGGPNTYSGGTVVNAGAVSVSSDANLGADPSAPTPANLVINGGTLFASAGFTLNSSRGVALGAGSGAGSGEIDVAAGQTLTFNGIVANHGATDSLVVGSGGNTGALTLGSLGTYSGSTTVNAGALELNSAEGNGTLAAGSVTVNAGGTLAAGPGYGAIDQTFLTQIATTSAGAVALGALSGNTLNFSTFTGGLSLGAIGSFAYSGTLTPSGSTYMLGGGGGALTMSNALTASDSLDVGDNGASGAVILSAFSSLSTTTVYGGVLEFNSTGDQAPNSVAVDAGGTLEAGPAYGAIDQAFINQIASSSAGTVALGATSGNILSFSGYSSLSLGAVGAQTYSGALTPNATSYLLGGGGGTLTVSSALNASGVGLVVSGLVILTASGNTYNGATTINVNSSLQLGSAGATGSIPNTSSVTDYGSLIFDLTNTNSFTPTIGGSGSLAQIGTGGTTILGNSNSYSGPTTITAGTLSIGADASLGAAPTVAVPADVVINGGVLLANSSFALNPNRGIAVGPASGSGGGEIDAATGQTLTYGNSVQLVSVSESGTTVTATVASISGTGLVLGARVTISGVSAAGQNTAGYNGVFTITSVNVNLNQFTYTSGATLATPLTGLTGAIASVGIIANNSAATTVGTGNLTLNSAANGGTIVLGGMNTYTGTTSLNGGVVQAGSFQPLGFDSAVTLSNSATFQLEGFNVTISTLKSSVTTTTIDNGGAANATLTVSPFNTGLAAAVFDGLLKDGGSGSLGMTVTGDISTAAKQGTEEFNNASNSYTGVTTVAGINANNVGALEVLADGDLGSTTSRLVLSGGDLFAGANITLSATRSIALGGSVLGYGQIDVAANDTLTFGGIISNNSGSNQLYVGTSSTHTGTLALTATSINTYSNGTKVNYGTLSIVSDANLGVAPSSFTANNLTIAGILLANSTFTLNSNRGIGLGSIFTSSGSIGAGSSKNSGDIEVGSGFAFTYGGLIGNYDPGTNNLTVNSVAGHTGTLALTGTGGNGYIGTTTIDNGVLSIVSEGNLGVAPSSGPVANVFINNATLLAKGTFSLNANRTVNLGPTSGAGQGEIDVATGDTLTVNGIVESNGTSTSALVVGSGANNGTLLLPHINHSQGNGYGATTINAGVLLVNNVLDLGTGTTTINTNGTLAAGPSYGTGIDQNFLSLVSAASTGVVALGANSGNNLSFAGFTGGLSLGAIGSFTYSGALTPNGTTFRLGGGGGTLAVSNALTSSDSLVVGLNGTAAGAVVLNAASTLSATTVNGGALEFNSSGDQAAGTVTVNAGATVVAGPAYNGGNGIDQNFLNQIASASAGVVAVGANSANNLDFSSIGANLTAASLGAFGSVTYSGTLTPNGTTYRLGGGGGTLALSNALGGGNSVVIATNGTTAGAVIMDALGTYTGNTAVSAGTLELNSSGTLPAGTVIVAAGATVAAGPGYGAIDQSFLGQINSISGGVVALGGNSGNNLDFSSNGANLAGVSLGATGAFTYSGMLTPNGTTYLLGGGGGTLTVSTGLVGSSDGLTVTLNGTSLGSVILTGANSYGGVTKINLGGILQLGNGGPNGGIPNSASVTDNGALVFDESGSNTFSQTVSGSGSIIQMGGTTVLGTSNSYSGGTTIDAGALSISADGSVGAAPSLPSAGNLIINGGTLIAASTFALNPNRGIALGPNSGSGSGAIEVAANQTLTYGGIIANNTANGTGGLTVGNLTSDGNTGTLALTGGGSTYTGPTATYAGVLSIASDLSLGADPGAATPSDVVIDGGVLFLATNQANLNANRGIAIGPSSGTGAGEIDVVAGQSVSYSGIVANNGSSTDSLVVGSGANSGGLTLGGNNSYTGSTIVNAGTLEISSDANLGADPASPTPGNLVLNNGTELVLQGAGLVVNANRGVAIGPATGLGSAAIDVSSTVPDTIAGIIANNGAGAGGLTVNVGNGSGTLLLSGINTYTGPTVIQNGAVQAGSFQPFGNTAVTVDGAAQLQLNGNNVSVGSLAGSGGVTDAGQATSQIQSMSWLNGTMTVTLINPSTLSTGQKVTILGVNPQAFDSSAGPYTITVLSSTQFTYPLAANPGTYMAGGYAVGGGAVPANAVLTVGGLDANTTFSGSLSNGLTSAVSLAVSGGSLTLSGRNTYTGSTTVTGGTLTITGTTSSTSWASVYDGGTLGGSGTLSAEVASNGQLTPGGTDQFTTGNLYFGNASGAYNVVLNGTTPGAGYDQDVVASPTGVDLSGNPTLNLSLGVGFVAPPGSQYTIIANQAGGPVTGIFANLPQGALLMEGSQNFTISYTGGPNGDNVVLISQNPKTSTTTTLTEPGSTPNPSNATQPLNFNIQVSGGSPTGTVEIEDTTNVTPVVVASGTLTAGENGAISLTIPADTIFAGSHNLQAIYLGDSNYNASPLSNTIVQQVNLVILSATVDGSQGNTTITSASENGSGLVTITTAAANGFTAANEPVKIAVTGQPGFNGIYDITQTSPTTFTYQDNNASGLPTTTGTNVGSAVYALSGAQRSMVTNVVYVFSEPVTTLTASDFTLGLQSGVSVNGGAGQTVGNTTGVNLTVSNPSGDGMTWVVGFSGTGITAGSLSNGVYTMLANTSLITSMANPTQEAQARSTDTFARMFGSVAGEVTVSNSTTVTVKAANANSCQAEIGLLPGAPTYEAYFDASGAGTRSINASDLSKVEADIGLTYTSFLATI
jgi:fibronectin-binding autotransporter adhesin